MAQRDRSERIALFSDVPGDERQVRAILADWGLAEDAIATLLAQERPCWAFADPAPAADPPPRKRTHMASVPAPPAPRAH